MWRTTPDPSGDGFKVATKEGVLQRQFWHLAQRVNLNPDPGKLPGGHVLQNLTNGLAGFALIFCLVGLVAGAGLWALGSNSNNYQQTVVGKKALGVCTLAALLIGAAAAIINFFYGAGRSV